MLAKLARRGVAKLRREVTGAVTTAYRRWRPFHRGRTLFVYGHSYAALNAFGVESWSRRVAEALDLPMRNYAVPGQRVEGTEPLARVARGRPDERDLVLVEAGLNDTIFHGSDPEAHAAFRDTLGSIVQRLQAKGADVVVVADAPLASWGLPAPTDKGSDEASATYRDDCRSVGCPVIDLSEGGWDGAAMLGGDGAHPNERGAEHLANRIVEELRRLGLA